jgi:hypothetical protein
MNLNSASNKCRIFNLKERNLKANFMLGEAKSSPSKRNFKNSRKYFINQVRSKISSTNN